MPLTAEEREEMEVEVSVRRQLRHLIADYFGEPYGTEDLDDLLIAMNEFPALTREEIQLGLIRLRKLAKLASIPLHEIN